MAEIAFDQTCFDSLVKDIGEEMAAKVIGVFFVDTEKYLDRLAAIECEAGREAAKIQVHAIKSSAATFGFNRLAALARRLEADLAAMPATDFSARVGELQAAFAAARAGFGDQARRSRRVT